ncbi:MAG: type 4a pilus biogenesis protein PilO [PVC group bacterium]|nr:type 4a pilus biogenesis protein PilO [PVC group bacterium]
MIGSGFSLPKEIKNTLAIGVTIFVVVLFFGGRFIYKRSLKKLIGYKKQRSRVELENKVGKKLAELQKIRENMPIIKESAHFLSEVAKVAGALNMNMVSISAQPVERRKDMVKFSVQMELDTTYHQLGAFISKIEGGDLFVNVDALDIRSKSNQETTKAAIVAEITVHTFYLTDTDLEK